jgi:hypothetical protein
MTGDVAALRLNAASAFAQSATAVSASTVLAAGAIGEGSSSVLSGAETSIWLTRSFS